MMTRDSITIARIHAVEMAHYLSAAAWSSDDREYLIAEAKAEFALAAAALGYRIAEDSHDPPTEALTVQPNPALVA